MLYYVPGDAENVLGFELQKHYSNVVFDKLPAREILQSTPFEDFLDESYENHTAKHVSVKF